MTAPGSRKDIPGSDIPGSAIPGRQPSPKGRGPSALVWRWWNLLLLLPLLMLITPWFNFDKPRVFGLPFFYWYQLVFVFVGVACVAIVYAMTRTAPAGATPPPTAVTPDDRRAGGAMG